MKNKLLLLLFLGMFLISFASAYSGFGNSLDNGLVAYYPMDEFAGTTSYDFKGTNHLIMQSASGWQGGKLSYSIGNNNTGYTVNSTSIIGSSQTEFGYTVSFWVYKTGITPSEYSSFIRVGVNDSQVNIGNCEWVFGEYGYNQSHILFGANTVDQWADTTTWRNWTHYVLKYTNGENMQVYRNGVWIKNSTNTRNNCGLQNATSPLRLFMGTTAGYSPTKEVFIDEIGVWNRGINQTEISFLYNASRGVKYAGADYTTILNNYSSNVYETETSNAYFALNISTVSGKVPISPYFVYNGIAYSTQVYNLSGYYLINYTLPITQIPVGANTFYYSFNLSGTITNTTNYTQTKSAIQFGLCNASLTTKYLNISFKDEATDNFIKASIPSSTFVYYLGNGTINKTYTYTTSTTNYYYTFCASPSDRPYYIDAYVQYKNDTSYPQRIYNPDLGTYLNTTSNVTLYLLDSTDGIYVTIQVINSQDQLLSGVEVIGTRVIGTTTTEVARGTTGASGTVTFWLNPDFALTFTFTKEGFTTFVWTEIPTQTSYTITLSGGITTNTNDYTRGIKTYTYPRLNELNNDTNYNFIFNLTSSYWDLDSFGFNLRLSNGTIIAGDTSTTSGDGSNLVYNVNNQSIIYMDYYWVINGNYTNGTKYWIITNTLNTGWSIKTFFEDLNLYLDSGIFGLDNFGRSLLVFLILFLSVGFLVYKYGITEPVVISIIIFAIVFFLDVVVGLIPTIRGINNLVTYIAGVIVALTIIGEVNR